jgi:hypothetical protein
VRTTLFGARAADESQEDARYQLSATRRLIAAFKSSRESMGVQVRIIYSETHSLRSTVGEQRCESKMIWHSTGLGCRHRGPMPTLTCSMRSLLKPGMRAAVRWRLHTVSALGRRLLYTCSHMTLR